MIMLCRARYNLEVQEISLTIDQRHWCQRQFGILLHDDYTATPLKVEASHRLFYRIADSHKSYVLMVSPPELEQNEQFVAMQKVFYAQGIPVPELIAHDFLLGLFLMSDLGKIDLEQAYATSNRSLSISTAIDCLHKIQVIDSAPPYTAERFETELAIFQEWFVDNTLHHADIGMSNITAPLLNAIISQPIGCVHRDFHCRNLLFNDGKLGVVDFQDALIGPALYDLASLLRDCYYVFSEAEIDQWLTYYLSAETPLTKALKAFKKTEIRRMLDFTAIQRQLKAIGIFARLNLRDQKSSHLQYIAPLLERLIDLTHLYEDLAPLNVQLNSCLLTYRSHQ